MADTTYTGTGVITADDYHAVKWTGLTKGGKAVTIEMPKAINKGNLDWTFAEKNDVVAQIVFEGVYSNTDAMASATTEPYTITIEEGLSSGASEIMLGAGVVSIDGVDVALTRGGSQFVVEREFREINADGDRGAVEGRIVMDASRPKLTLNTLQILTKLADLYPAMQ